MILTYWLVCSPLGENETDWACEIQDQCHGVDLPQVPHLLAWCGSGGGGREEGAAEVGHQLGLLLVPRVVIHSLLV